MNVVKHSVQIGSSTIEFETGRLAKQASGAVVVSSLDSKVLVTARAPIRLFFIMYCTYRTCFSTIITSDTLMPIFVFEIISCNTFDFWWIVNCFHESNHTNF